MTGALFVYNRDQTDTGGCKDPMMPNMSVTLFATMVSTKASLGVIFMLLSSVGVKFLWPLKIS
jgi:hypothetical protein